MNYQQDTNAKLIKKALKEIQRTDDELRLCDAQSFDFEELLRNYIQYGLCNLSVDVIKCYNIIQYSVRKNIQVNVQSCRNEKTKEQLELILSQCDLQQFVQTIQNEYANELLIKSDNGSMVGINGIPKKQSADLAVPGKSLKKILPKFNINETIEICDLDYQLSFKLIQVLTRCINQIQFDKRDTVIEYIEDELLACFHNGSKQRQFQENNQLFQISCKTYGIEQNKYIISIADYNQIKDDTPLMKCINVILEKLTLSQSIHATGIFAGFSFKPTVTTNPFDRQGTGVNDFGFFISITDIFNKYALQQINNILDQCINDDKYLGLDPEQTIAFIAGLVKSKKIKIDNIYDQIVHREEKDELTINKILNSTVSIMYNQIDEEDNQVYNITSGNILNVFLVQDRDLITKQLIVDNKLYIFELDSACGEINNMVLKIQLGINSANNAYSDQMKKCITDKQYKRLQVPDIQFDETRQMIDIEQVIQNIKNKKQQQDQDQVIQEQERCNHDRVICKVCNIMNSQEVYGLYEGWIKCGCNGISHSRKCKIHGQSIKAKCGHGNSILDCQDCKQPCSCKNRKYWRNCKDCVDQIQEYCCDPDNHKHKKELKCKICKCKCKNKEQHIRIDKCADCMDTYCVYCIIRYIADSSYKIEVKTNTEDCGKNQRHRLKNDIFKRYFAKFVSSQGEIKQQNTKKDKKVIQLEEEKEDLLPIDIIQQPINIKPQIQKINKLKPGIQLLQE